VKQPRTVEKIFTGQVSIDGAGVRLQRLFGYREASLFDPFLLLDYFGSDRPEDYRNGFPWHPHRGIETITYMIEGFCEHGDSLGNKGVIGTGDVQWMTAGSGIIHQEMPQGDEKGRMFGFQLWANLPGTHKMMPPRYRDIKDSAIPRVRLANGTEIRIICGTVEGVRGPAEDVVIDPEYLDVYLPAQTAFSRPLPDGHTAFIAVFKNGLRVADTAVGQGAVALLSQGDGLTVQALEKPARFLLVSGKPLKEPIACRGPIVMNTQEELAAAFQAYNNGTFIQKQHNT